MRCHRGDRKCVYVWVGWEHHGCVIGLVAARCIASGRGNEAAAATPAR